MLHFSSWKRRLPSFTGGRARYDGVFSLTVVWLFNAARGHLSPPFAFAIPIANGGGFEKWWAYWPQALRVALSWATTVFVTPPPHLSSHGRLFKKQRAKICCTHLTATLHARHCALALRISLSFSRKYGQSCADNSGGISSRSNLSQ